MKKFPIINTERLILSELKKENGNNLFSYFSKNEATKYFNIETFTERKVCKCKNIFYHKCKILKIKRLQLTKYIKSNKIFSLYKKKDN